MMINNPVYKFTIGLINYNLVHYQLKMTRKVVIDVDYYYIIEKIRQILRKDHLNICEVCLFCTATKTYFQLHHYNNLPHSNLHE